MTPFSEKDNVILKKLSRLARFSSKGNKVSSDNRNEPADKKVLSAILNVLAMSTWD